MKKSLIIVYGLLILISLLCVNAIGIGPARVIIDFEPNLEMDLEYYILNNIDLPINVDMYTKGDLNEYITFDESSFKLNPGKSKIIIAHLSLPEKLDQPGTNQGRIGALASPIGGEGAMVAAKAGVESQLYIEVPYEGKYLSAKIDVNDVKVGETAEFIVTVSNQGKEDITDVNSIIEVYDKEDIKITEISTNQQGLKAGETKELKAEWNTQNAQPGSYKAKALINYDGDEKQIETGFNIGDILIEIIKLETNDFNPGEIAKFTLEIQSNWNEKINNVYAVLEIYDGENLLGTAESKETDIQAWSKESLDIFWDSTGITPGDYKVKATLYYEGKTSEKDFDIEIKKKSYTWIVMLSIAIIILIAYLLWFIWKKRKKKSKKKKR